MNTPECDACERYGVPCGPHHAANVKRSDCLCGVCAMLATATPTLHTHATRRAADQCSQPGCIPPARGRAVA